MKTIETKELCQRYRKLYMPAVCDALYHLGLAEQVLPTSLRPLFPEKQIVGRALTVEGRAIEPRLAWDPGIARIRPYLKVFETIPPDSVLVSVNPDSAVGHFGELTGNSAQVRGCAGVILDGNLRDIEGLREIGFQVFYRDLSPLNAIGRWEMVATQKPVKIGSVTINPDDIIFAEFDGILVIPAAQAEQVLLKAEEIVAAEKRVRKEMREGLPPLSGLEKHGYI
jgi:4-hydroxy-4-methyl-2-oxoglutarate aldolase